MQLTEQQIQQQIAESEAFWQKVEEMFFIDKDINEQIALNVKAIEELEQRKAFAQRMVKTLAEYKPHHSTPYRRDIRKYNEQIKWHKKVIAIATAKLVA